MNDDYDPSVGLGFVIVIVIISVFIGVLVGFGIGESCYKKQAIEHGCAQYNTKTGDWEWKDFTQVKEDTK